MLREELQHFKLMCVEEFRHVVRCTRPRIREPDRDLIAKVVLNGMRGQNSGKDHQPARANGQALHHKTATEVRSIIAHDARSLARPRIGRVAR